MRDILHDRDPQREPGALALAGARTAQGAAELLRGDRRRVQPVAVAVRLGGEPGLEDPCAVLAREAHAGVADLDAEVARGAVAAAAGPCAVADLGPEVD